MLRTLTGTLLVALLLDAPAGRGRRVRPVAALDVSASWLRAQDEGAWRAALSRARALGADTLLLIGDSLRPSSAGAFQPLDLATRVRPAVERATAAGRPLELVTDGAIDDPEALQALPGGSRVIVVPRRERSDLAVVALMAPARALSGDSQTVRATVRAGGAGSAPGSVAFTLEGRELGTLAVGRLSAYAETVVTLRVPFGGARDGPALLRAVVRAAGDGEARNDTIGVVVDLARVARAVFVSTAPDYDARFTLALMRGALALPTAAYVRVAPGEWRREGSLTAVSEGEVRASAAAAPLLVLHGDSGVFGPPRALSRGALLLFAPARAAAGSPAAATADDDWYVTGAPASPLAAGLAGTPWDSLPPVRPAARGAAGEWEGLELRRARRLERFIAVSGSARPRRVVTVGASGFWRWHFRGGVGANAYAALWGGIFDWLAEERPDRRAAVPADSLIRAGERVRWRRGPGADSIARLQLTRRGGSGSVDSVTLDFGRDAIVDGPALAAGVYDVLGVGGSSLLVVNPSREWVPRVPTVRTGRVGVGPPPGDAPGLRSLGWPYLLLVGALCAEWLLRRRAGLR